ncbi:MAG: hypothetical protein K0S12_194 [Bacteroidetes bacterium]|nr:hypothetical protein [Bacteroidota bacterium]
MNDNSASPHADLLKDIAILKEKKQRDEKILKESLKQAALSLKPISFIKESILELTTDKNVKQDLFAAGIQLSSNFLIEKILNKNVVSESSRDTSFMKRLNSSFHIKEPTSFSPSGVPAEARRIN